MPGSPDGWHAAGRMLAHAARGLGKGGATERKGALLAAGRAKAKGSGHARQAHTRGRHALGETAVKHSAWRCSGSGCKPATRYLISAGSQGYVQMLVRAKRNGKRRAARCLGACSGWARERMAQRGAGAHAACAAAGGQQHSCQHTADDGVNVGQAVDVEPGHAARVLRQVDLQAVVVAVEDKVCGVGCGMGGRGWRKETSVSGSGGEADLETGVRPARHSRNRMVMSPPIDCTGEPMGMLALVSRLVAACVRACVRAGGGGACVVCAVGVQARPVCAVRVVSRQPRPRGTHQTGCRIARRR